MGRLILRLLGTPEVSHAEQPLTFQTRKVLALLAYLVVEQGVHSRDKITALLWPDSDEERGKASLRRALSYVRQSLDELSHERSGHVPLHPPHVLIDHQTLSFNLASDFEGDTQALHTAFTLVRRRSSGDLRTHLAHLQKGASSYRGTFLDGLSVPDAPDFEDWLLLQRESWRRQANTVFDRLSQWQIEGGELENALDTTNRWIEQDLLNEHAHARLIQLHFALGNRAAALEAFERCRAVLERELSAEPSSEIMVLADRMRSRPSPVREPVMPEAPSPRRAWEFPLTGRVAEYRALVTAFQTTLAGHMQVATLEGEPGIGKTRLAKEFLRWARAQGADVLEARAFETGSRLPYQPLVEAMRSRLEREQDLQALLSEVWLAELARLLPEFREQVRDLPPPLSLDEAEARTRLFEAIARLGHALAKRAPLVLFIDDAQWADAASLDVLQYANRRWASAHLPVFLLCTFRSDDLASSVALADWLSSLERNLPVRRQALTTLTFEETMRLVGSFFAAAKGTPGDGGEGQLEMDESIEAWSQWLFAQTRGHPFFLIEHLKMITERRGLLQQIEAGTVKITPDLSMPQVAAPSALPSSVRDFIRARLTRLGQSSLTLCMAAAVLGDGCTFEQLCRVADLSDNQGLPALDEVVTRGLLQETGGRCFFVHDSIRGGVYAEAGETRRRVLHRRALETLQAAIASPAELAHHALGAGLADAAARLSIAAGDAAMRVFAVRDAIAHYEQARQLVRRSHEYLQPAMKENMLLSQADLSQVYLQLGWAYELSSQFAQAESTYEELLTLARALHESVMECAALNRLATQAAENSQDLARAEELLQQALAIAESSQNKAGVAETAWNLAQTGFYAARMSESLPHAQRALALARELNQQELIGRSLHALATLEVALGKQEESLSHAEEARILYAALGNRAREVGCLCVIAKASIDGGQLQEGIDAAKAALAMSEAMEYTWGHINAAIQLVPGLLDRGVYGEAFAVGQQAVALARALEIVPLLVLTLGEQGNVCRAMLAPEEAKIVHSEALARCEDFMPPHYVGWIAGELCADCVVAGQWQQAYTYALKAIAARDPTILFGGVARWYEIAALLWGESADQAREEVRRFGVGMNNKGRSALHYLRSLAVLAQSRGEIDAAMEHLQEAARVAEEVGLPGELWSMCVELGEMYQKQGDERQANQAFSRAAEILHSLADTIKDYQQCTSFLSAPLVKRVLEHVRFLE